MASGGGVFIISHLHCLPFLAVKTHWVYINHTPPTGHGSIHGSGEYIADQCNIEHWRLRLWAGANIDHCRLRLWTDAKTATVGCGSPHWPWQNPWLHQSVAGGNLDHWRLRLFVEMSLVLSSLP